MTDKKLTESMTLAPGVVDTIISIAVNEVDGIASLGNPVTRGILSRFANKPSTSGIEASFDEDGRLRMTLHIEVYYGYVLPELADNLRKAISDALLVQVGIEVSNIDVFVDGIQFKQ